MGKITKVPNEINEKIVELRKDWLVIRNIQASILEQFNRKVSFWYIQKICKQFKETWWAIDTALEELNNAIEERPPYEISNGNYIFIKDEVIYPVLIETIDNIFKDYSKHWANMNWQEIMSKYKLKPEVWSLIKSRLKLYKTSNIISPYSLEHMSKEGSDEYIESNVNEALQDKYKRTFERKYKAIKEREFKKYSNYYHQQQEFLNQLETVLKRYDPKELTKHELKKIPEIDNNDTIDVWFSDLHLGKMDTQWVLNRINKLRDTLISRPEKNINLLFLWDIAETLMEWGFHPGMTESMDWPFWFDLILMVVSTIEKLLTDLYLAWKNVSLYNIWWNHWRLAPDHNQDQWRTWELVVFELIKRWVEKINVNVQYFRERINVLNLETFSYIVHHWDDWFANKAQKNAEKILWNNAKDNSKHNIIMFGDRHTVSVTEWKNYTTIWTPALAGQNTFDKRIDVHSAPWFIIIKKNVEWDPDITIVRVK